MQLESLLKSNYLYSVTVDEVTKPNTYLKYDAGIGFKNTSDAKTGINADVIMQTLESEYTEDIYWNADKLKENEIAISEGLAKEYGLKVGSQIYSKHIVDGTIHEYVINKILPDVTSVRIEKNQDLSEGIIIMGFDSNYADNVIHNTLLFTNEDIKVLSNETHGDLSNIIYREDEIKKVCIEILPYYVFIVVLSVTIVICLITVLRKNIVYNFKRLIMFGFNQKRLNRALFSFIGGVGIISIGISFLNSLIITETDGLNRVEMSFLITIVMVECFALLIGELFIKRNLWRQ